MVMNCNGKLKFAVIKKHFPNIMESVFLSFTISFERRFNLVSLYQRINDRVVQLDGSFFAWWQQTHHSTEELIFFLRRFGLIVTHQVDHVLYSIKIIKRQNQVIFAVPDVHCPVSCNQCRPLIAVLKWLQFWQSSKDLPGIAFGSFGVVEVIDYHF